MTQEDYVLVPDNSDGVFQYKIQIIDKYRSYSKLEKFSSHWRGTVYAPLFQFGDKLYTCNYLGFGGFDCTFKIISDDFTTISTAPGFYDITSTFNNMVSYDFKGKPYLFGSNRSTGIHYVTFPDTTDINIS